MADFKKLKVWQKAHALALGTHEMAGKIRGAGNMSLKSQMIRAAMSIDSNIVEGRGKNSDKEFARYLRTALNSASELESHFIMASDLGIIATKDFATKVDQTIEVRKMLHGLIDRIGGDS
ncbi:MAG: four helix bundle protein [Gemmatimonadaceae bacterium]